MNINQTHNNMAQQTPDPKLIDSMAMRYRHDFGLLEEPQKESIRTTMKQLWEEVVGLGFYKDEQFGNSEQLAQQTAKEKAQELIDKFYEPTLRWGLIHAKKCALIALENEYKSLREQLFNLRSCHVIENEKVYLVRIDFLNKEESELRKEIEKL